MLAAIRSQRLIYFSRVLRVKPFSSFSGSESTIYALATGGVRCALAVIRISGSESGNVLKKMTRLNHLPEPRKAIYKKLYDSSSQEDKVLDHGILLWFPGPKSYTGEDSCEFHVHGGPAVISSILRSIGNIPGCRMAEPGEFTKKAFLNGKMDLTEVDGLSDLISAETEMQRMQAVNQLDGSLGALYESWRDRIAKCLANAEAYIDFGEDENIENDILETVEEEVKGLIADIKCHLNDERKGERLRNGIRVAIIGKTNVGKSSLLNILCEREAAIVSQIPGTTRDVIEITVNFRGYPVIFADTAGIRSTSGDVIEVEGMRRSFKEAQKADIVILMTDATKAALIQSHSVDDLVNEELSNIFSQDPANECIVDLVLLKKKLLLVMNKVDLFYKDYNNVRTSRHAALLELSCKTNSGMTLFLEALGTRVASLCADPKSEAPYLTHERYRSHLQNCGKNLEQYLTAETMDLALKTQNLKSAMNSIGFITGHFGTEDILDILFRDFCIGK